jgi:hypothetical protein
MISLYLRLDLSLILPLVNKKSHPLWDGSKLAYVMKPCGKKLMLI